MFQTKMRMAYKLGLGFTLVTCLTLVLGGIALWQMTRMHAGTQAVAQQALPSVTDVGHLRALWNQFRRFEAGVLNVNSLAEVDGYAQQMAQVLSQMDGHERSYAALPRDSQEQALMAQYQQQRKQYMEHHQAFMDLARDKDYSMLDGDLLLGDVVTNYYAGVAEPRFAELLDSLSQLQVLSSAYAQAAEQAAGSSFQFARVWVLASMALSALLAVVLGWRMTRAVTVPVAQAVRAARSIAHGDLTQEIPAGRSDELGHLLQELRLMRDSLGRVVSEVRSNAEGVSSVSEQIAMGNVDLSNRTEAQAGALQQTAASIEQMSGTVRHNAETAAQANQLAISASEIAERGGDVVQRVVQTMSGIDSSSQKIEAITGVIDSIAFQTNILALNAAVEAARAGDQGRGFAVVASEVRVLAQRSAEAAQQIKRLIGESVERVDQGSHLVTQAGETMHEVVSAIRRVADLVGEISAAGQEQSLGVQQVSEAVLQMDRSTQQNAALVEQGAAATEGLKRQAQELVTAVARFRLHQQHTAGGSAPVRMSVEAWSPPAPHRQQLVAAAPQGPVRMASASTKQAKPASAPVSAVASTATEDDWETF